MFAPLRPGCDVYALQHEHLTTGALVPALTYFQMPPGKCKLVGSVGAVPLSKQNPPITPAHKDANPNAHAAVHVGGTFG